LGASGREADWRQRRGSIIQAARASRAGPVQ